MKKACGLLIILVSLLFLSHYSVLNTPVETLSRRVKVFNETFPVQLVTLSWDQADADDDGVDDENECVPILPGSIPNLFFQFPVFIDSYTVKLALHKSDRPMYILTRDFRI